MNKDIQQINQSFIMTLLGLIGVLLVFAGLVVVAALFIPGDFQYAAYFVLLLALLFIVPKFGSRLDRLMNISYIIKIRGNEAPPLPVNHFKQTKDIYDWMKKNEFIRYVNIPSHALYYKVTKDPVKKIFRKYVLEVFVLIHTKNDQFYLDAVDDEIEKIQSLLQKDKKRIFAMTITQVKRIDELDDNLKEKIKEIVFVRTRRGIISTINIGVHEPTKQAIMLYADKYSPSLYYKYHLDQIRHLI